MRIYDKVVAAVDEYGWALEINRKGKAMLLEQANRLNQDILQVKTAVENLTRRMGLEKKRR